MDWLLSNFGSGGSPFLQYVSIFAIIFAILTVIVLVVRRLSGQGLAVSGRGTQRGRQPRLGIVDIYELDRARQLILLRRDNVEHLLLVGGPNDVVIERNIQRGQRAAMDPVLRPEAGVEPSPEIEARRPDPGLFEPSFEMPMVVPPAVPGSNAPPPVTHPLDAAAVAPEGETALTEELDPPVRRAEPPKRPLRRTTPPLINSRPDVASERGRPATATTATLDTTALRASATPTEAPPERPTEAPAEAVRPQPEEPGRASPPLPPPVSAPPTARPVDPKILSDMARQLEIALARPSSAVTPPPEGPPRDAAAGASVAAAMSTAAAPVPSPPGRPPAPPEPPRPVAVPTAQVTGGTGAAGTDPMAAAMATVPAPPPKPAPGGPAAAAPKPFLPSPPPPATPSPPPPPTPAPSTPNAAAAATRPPGPAPVDRPAATRDPLPKPASPPAPAAPNAASAAPPPPPPAPARPNPPAPAQPAAAKPQNPFSVEEIEAEFARLLGRPLDKR
ncbi:hypothetical protein [Methylobacterium sp. A54F]